MKNELSAVDWLLLEKLSAAVTGDGPDLTMDECIRFRMEIAPKIKNVGDRIRRFNPTHETEEKQREINVK